MHRQDHILGKCYQVDDLAQMLMKGVANYDMLWRVVCTL